jgi:acetyltransferase-like isoleucine patch superfamily enzyme
MKAFKTIFLFLKRRIMNPIDYYRSLGVNIGQGCRIFTNRFGREPWLITIGNNVTLTSGVSIVTHDGSTWLCRDDKGRRYLFKKVVIGNNVFVGLNATILPGVVVEDDVIIAAGSVVVKSVPKGSIIGGNPAKIIGDFYRYREQVLSTYVSDEDMDFSKDYKERILEILDNRTKPFYQTTNK